MSRWLYQTVAEPINVLANPLPPTSIDVWEPHAEIPRLRPRKFHASLYLNPAPVWISTRVVRPLGIASTASVGRPALLHSGSTYELFIGGVQRFELVNTLRIENSIGGRGSMNFTIHSESGTYRPTDMETVTLYNRGVRRFGGFVQRVVDEVIEGNDATEVAIQCINNRGFTDRVVVAKLYTVSIGGLLWIIFFDIWQEKLQQFGITYVFEGDPLIVLDDILFHYVTVTEVFDRLIAKAPGWAWWIDENKQLHLKQTTTAAAASLSDTARTWENMRVTLEAGMYRNKQWVLPSGSVVSQRTETFSGDGSATDFITDYILTVKPIVKVDGVAQNVTPLGTWTVAYDWYYIPYGQGVFQKSGNPPLTVAQTLTVIYPNPWPLGVSAQDDAEIALRGLVEAVEHVKDVGTAVEAQAIAAGLLEAFSGNGVPEIVEYETNEEIETNWPVPGTLQAINVAHPATSGNKVIESVSSELLDLTLWKHKVRARKGDFNADYQAILETLIKTARVSIISPPMRATFEMDMPNLGQAVGLAPNRYTVQLPPGSVAAVIDSWDGLFPADPPSGLDYIADILLNGSSIFPAGNPNKIVMTAGSTAQQSGFTFSSTNLQVVNGDVLSFNVIQVGSVLPGKYALFHLNLVV